MDINEFDDAVAKGVIDKIMSATATSKSELRQKQVDTIIECLQVYRHNILDEVYNIIRGEVPNDYFLYEGKKYDGKIITQITRLFEV